MSTWLAGILALGLAMVHVVGGRLRFLRVIPRSRWLSAAGGVSVAYVFVHILPDLASSQESIQSLAPRWAGGYLEHHVYLLALVGLLVFYGLERMVQRARRRTPASRHKEQRSDESRGSLPGVFWIHVGSFSLYNLLIGYLLLHRERPGTLSLALFASAMATHFLVNDYGLEMEHKQRYRHIGRWLLSAAVLVGWAIGAVTDIHRAVVALFFSFLAGGIIFNVLKEELPEDRQSAFWAFAVGAAGYTVLLLTI